MLVGHSTLEAPGSKGTPLITMMQSTKNKTKKPAARKQQKRAPRNFLGRQLRQPKTKNAPIAINTQVKGNPPRIQSGRNSITITHRELFTQMTLGPDEAFPQDHCFVWDYRINPSNINLCPWLATMAANYEKYRIKRLMFEYRPMCPTTQAGWVALSVDYDPDDDHLSTSLLEEKQVAMNRVDSIEGSLWAKHTLELRAPSLSRIGERWIFGGPEERVAEDRTTYAAVLYVTAAGPADAAYVGELYVSYTVELLYPQGVSRQADVATATLSAFVNSSAGEADPEQPILQTQPENLMRHYVYGPTSTTEMEITSEKTKDSPVEFVLTGPPEQVGGSRLWQADTALKALQTGIYELFAERTVKPAPEAVALDYSQLNKPTVGDWVLEEKGTGEGDTWHQVGHPQHRVTPFPKASLLQDDYTGDATETFSWVGQLTKGKLYRFICNTAIPTLAKGIGRYLQIWARSSNGIRTLGQWQRELLCVPINLVPSQATKPATLSELTDIGIVARPNSACKQAPSDHNKAPTPIMRRTPFPVRKV